ncbi:MAG: LPXTG cell wall anchor domain-containing protein [Planctomyces sp.]|nr:LPXTG cell wall anchor domain-containing protein [Planctomyces sp.]
MKLLVQRVISFVAVMLCSGLSYADIPLDRPPVQEPIPEPTTVTTPEPTMITTGDDFSMWMQFLAGALVIAGILATVVILRRRKA